jgi:NADH-quinone oxidoreductase subunit J
MLDCVIFYSLAALTLGSALCVVSMRNVIHSALFLGLSLAGVAGLYATLGADFVSAAQVLIYVSGIAVLILFVVMLAGRASDLLIRQVNEQWPAALFICLVLLVCGTRAFEPFRAVKAQSAFEPTTAALGRLLLGDLAFPFELISIVLMVALAGTVYFSKTEHEPGTAGGGAR